MFTASKLKRFWSTIQPHILAMGASFLWVSAAIGAVFPEQFANRNIDEVPRSFFEHHHDIVIIGLIVVDLLISVYFFSKINIFGGNIPRKFVAIPSGAVLFLYFILVGSVAKEQFLSNCDSNFMIYVLLIILLRYAIYAGEKTAERRGGGALLPGNAE